MIEVVSDVVCPWCFIGKRRLTKALALLGRADEPVRWKPFQLNPGAPREGFERAPYRTRKFGSAEFAQQLEDRVVEAAREEGLELRFDRVTSIPNSFDAHRLIRLAQGAGLQDQAVEALFQAYFMEGQDVGDPSVLLAVAASIGMSAPEVVEMLAGQAGAAEVRAEEEEARRRGVSGVPTFFVNGEPVTSGAHPAPLLASFLGTALGQGESRGAGGAS